MPFPYQARTHKIRLWTSEGCKHNPAWTAKRGIHSNIGAHWTPSHLRLVPSSRNYFGWIVFWPVHPRNFNIRERSIWGACTGCSLSQVPTLGLPIHSCRVHRLRPAATAGRTRLLSGSHPTCIYSEGWYGRGGNRIHTIRCFNDIPKLLSPRRGTLVHGLKGLWALCQAERSV